MITMSKEEIRLSLKTWPANTKQPVDKDGQIWLMKTAAWRHKAAMKRYNALLKKGKDNDPLG
jgi:hypothetical protein